MLIFVACISCVVYGCKSKSNDLPNAESENVQQSMNNIDNYQRDITAGRVIPIKVDEIEDLIKKKSEFTIAFTLTSCSKCAKFEKMFKDYKMIHHIDLYQVVLDNEENDDEDEVLKKIHKWFSDFENTPTLYFVKGNQVVDSCENEALDEESFDKWVQKNQIDKVSD